jgi:ABC-type glycerol-3-phosphate transport system substrate-binding protein
MLKRKTWLLVLSLVLMLLVGACTMPVAPGATAPGATEPGATGTGGEEGAGVLLTWITDLPEAETIAENYMEQNPDVSVRVDRVTFREVFSQNQVRLGSGSGDPDIVSVDAPLVASYASRGWLLPLNEYFSETETGGWVDAQVDSSQYQGELYAPPIWNSTQTLFYNRDLFEAAGITPPGPEERWTWEQVYDAAKALTQDTDGDGVNDIWGLQFAQFNRIYQLQPLPQGKPAPVISEDGLSVEGIIDSEEWIDAFTWFRDLHCEAQVAPQGTISVLELFAAGKLAMAIEGPWFITDMASRELDFAWGAAPHPYWEGGEVVVPMDSWHVGVNPNSEHVEEAVDFVQYLTSLEVDALWGELWGKWPIHKAQLEVVINDPDNQDWPGLAYGVAAREAEYAEPRPLTVGYLEYEEILSDAFEDIRNCADVTETLSFAAERIQVELDKYQ